MPLVNNELYFWKLDTLIDQKSVWISITEKGVSVLERGFSEGVLVALFSVTDTVKILMINEIKLYCSNSKNSQDWWRFQELG